MQGRIMEDWSIQSDDAHREAALAYQREQLMRCVEAYHKQSAQSSFSGFIDDGGATRRKMEQLLADNPDMPREDAFLQAVVGQAEEALGL